MVPAVLLKRKPPQIQSFEISKVYPAVAVRSVQRENIYAVQGGKDDDNSTVGRQTTCCVAMCILLGQLKRESRELRSEKKDFAKCQIRAVELCSTKSLGQQTNQVRLHNQSSDGAHYVPTPASIPVARLQGRRF